MNQKNIGQNLRILRRQRGLTQAQIAEKADVSTDHISHVEIGTSALSLPLLLDLCKKLEVTPNDILAGEYSPDSTNTENNSTSNLLNKDMDIERLNPDDRILLNYLYQFMTRRKKDI